ncbi:hypothetical protein Chor_011094 [Crotalus horridus]
MAAEAEAGAGPASTEWEAPTRVLRALTWLGQEFLSDWEAQDLRAALFQLLLLWLVVSLLGIQVAWRVYGNTVTSLYYRQGRAQATQVQKHIKSNNRDDQVWLLLRLEHRGWGCLPACPLRGLADSVQRESAIKVVISPMLWFSCWPSLVL